jgi:uncharacterized membrane protein YcjF (UPF0283 family)
LHYKDDDDGDEEGSQGLVTFQDTTTEVSHDEDERDEVQEIKKYTSKDTNKVRVWRVMVTCVLLLTGAAVVYTSYTFLRREETYKFKQAVSSVLTCWLYCCMKLCEQNHLTLKCVYFL